MEFDKSKVYTALNADELEVGCRCIFANNLDSLKCKVEEGTDIRPIVQILNDAYERRFKTDVQGEYPFAYLVSVPEEKDWIVYLCRRIPEDYYLTACRSDTWEEVQKDFGAKTKLFEGTEDEVDNWYTARKHFANIITAWEDGKHIQYFDDSIGEWCDARKPTWSTDTQYRIKPETLKWTDLKIGDIISDGGISYMITAIDTDSNTQSHVHFGGEWRGDFELEDWEKVE